MKQLFRTILIAILAIANGIPAMAQTNTSQRLTREELAVKQAQYIARELALNKSVTDKYVETYCNYQHEVCALGPHKNLTTEQRLERSQQILDLRKKYNTIYRGFLSENQLDKAYKLEKRLLERMGKNRPKSMNHKKRSNNEKK